MRPIIFIFAALLTGVGGFISCKQPQQTANLNIAKTDSLFTVLQANNKAMGSVAIFRNGQEVYSNSIGFADSVAGRKSGNRADTRYRVGSVSKIFTAVMIMQLVEESKLKLNSPLSDFYPRVPNAAQITIKNLLNHHSGLHNFTNDSTYMNWDSQTQTREEMLERIREHQPDFEPGEKAAYSNTNFVLLGYIIEQLTGESYHENLQQRICRKIGLESTYYGAAIGSSEGEAASFANWNGNWQKMPETHMSIPHGAGAVVSTAGDLCTFITALFQGKLVADSTLEKMTRMTDDIGLGLFRFPVNNDAGYTHGGAIDGFRTQVSYIPADSTAVALTFNGLDYSLDAIFNGVLRIYYGAPYDIPAFLPSIEIKDLAVYEGNYASKDMPLKIVIKSKGDYLTAQATGQGAFALDPKSETEFHFDPAGIVIEFTHKADSLYDEFVLKQGGLSSLYKKE